jgi:GxxExxY protein
VARNTRYPRQDLTRQIIGCFYEVYNPLGSGFREVVYKRALAIALTDRGMEAECEVQTSVFFRDRAVGTFRADIVVNRATDSAETTDLRRSVESA